MSGSPVQPEPLKICPPQGDYSENDINSVNFEIMLNENLSYIKDEGHPNGCFTNGMQELVESLKQDIIEKKECLCEGFLIDTMKDFLDTSSTRCQYRIRSCTNFNNYKDSDVNIPLAKKLQSIQEKAEENGDSDMITCYSSLNSLVYDIISNNDDGERKIKYEQRFPEFCCVDFTPIGTLFNSTPPRRLSDNAMQITGLCSEFDSGGDCVPGINSKQLDDVNSLCIINFAISILKSAFRPLDDICIKITKDNAIHQKNTFLLNIKKKTEDTKVFVIKTGAGGYFTVEKLTFAINKYPKAADKIFTNSNELEILINDLIYFILNKSANVDVARKTVLCLLMCIKTAGDFIKMFTVYILNKVNLFGTSLNTIDNIYFLTHDKSAMNLALCLDIHCLGGTGSASNYNPSGTSIRFFYWNSLPKWYKTNLKQKLVGLGYKFYYTDIPKIQQTEDIDLQDIIYQEKSLDNEDMSLCPPSQDGNTTLYGGVKTSTSAIKKTASASAAASASASASAALATKKTIAKPDAKDKATEKAEKAKAKAEKAAEKTAKKAEEDKAKALSIAKTYNIPDMVKPTLYKRSKNDQGKYIISWVPQTRKDLSMFKTQYQHSASREVEKGSISPRTYIKLDRQLRSMDIQKKFVKEIIGDPNFQYQRIKLKNAYANLNAAIITQLFTPRTTDANSNLIEQANIAIKQFGNNRPQTLPSFLEYSIDVSLMQRFISIVAIGKSDQVENPNISIQFDIIYNGFMVIQSMDKPIEKDILKSSVILKFRDFSKDGEHINATELRELFIKTIRDNITINDLAISSFKKFAVATITKEFLNSIIVEARIHCLAFSHTRRLIYFIEDNVKIPLITIKDLDLIFNANQNKFKLNTKFDYAESNFLKEGLSKLSKLVNRNHPCGPEAANSLQKTLPLIIKNLEFNIRIYSELYKKYKDITTYIDKLINLYNKYSINYTNYFNKDKLQLKNCSVLILLCESLLILVKFLCKLQIKLNDINLSINKILTEKSLGPVDTILIKCNSTDGQLKANILIAKTKKLYAEFREIYKSCHDFINETNSKSIKIRRISTQFTQSTSINIDITGISCVNDRPETLLAVLIREFALLINSCDGIFYASKIQKGFLPQDLGILSRQPTETDFFGGVGQITCKKYKNNEPKAANIANLKKVNNAKVPKVKEEKLKVANVANLKKAKVPKVKEEKPKANKAKVPKVKEEKPKANKAKVPKVKEEKPKANKAAKPNKANASNAANAKVSKVKEVKPKVANAKISNVKNY